MLPKTTVLPGPPPGDWQARNSLSYGIRIYSGIENGVGIWAEEYHEYWVAVLYLCLGMAGFAVAIAGHYLRIPYSVYAVVPSLASTAYFVLSTSTRQIFSCALNVQVGAMFGIDFETQALNSLETYEWVSDPTRDDLLAKMRARYLKARAWAEAHRELLTRVNQELA